LRFRAYILELEILMDLKNWPDLWNSNLDIIKHNQDIFYQRPYHRLDFSLYL